MAINYQKQCHDLFTLYEQDKFAECLEQGQRHVRDLPIPAYWRIKRRGTYSWKPRVTG